MNSTLPASSRRTGFTLIELLAVIAVMAIVIAFAIPATNQILRGSQLSQGTQLVGDQLALARQLALSKNRTIEVRFYRFGDPETPGEKFNDPKSGYWRGLQLFELFENGAAVPVGPFQRLPRMVIMDGTERSTLLDENVVGPYKKGTSDATAPELPVEVNAKRVGKDYEWTAFRFLPDGSTNLPLKATAQGGGSSGGGTADSWYFTVINMSDAGKELKNINYAVVQIDPVTGNQKTYRPTVGG
jgi:uncharacterized protein (TIGR02596 family)